MLSKLGQVDLVRRSVRWLRGEATLSLSHEGSFVFYYSAGLYPRRSASGVAKKTLLDCSSPVGRATPKCNNEQVYLDQEDSPHAPPVALDVGLSWHHALRQACIPSAHLTFERPFHACGAGPANVAQASACPCKVAFAGAVDFSSCHLNFKSGA